MKAPDQTPDETISERLEVARVVARKSGFIPVVNSWYIEDVARLLAERDAARAKLESLQQSRYEEKYARWYAEDVGRLTAERDATRAELANLRGKQ